MYKVFLAIIVYFSLNSFAFANELYLNIQNDVHNISIIKTYAIYETDGSLFCGKNNDGSWVPKLKFIDYTMDHNGNLLLYKKLTGILCKYLLSEIIVSAYNPHGYETDYASVRVVNEHNYRKLSLVFDIDELMQQQSFNFRCTQNKQEYGYSTELIPLASIEHEQLNIVFSSTNSNEF